MAQHRTDPVENMRSYIMVHGGVDRHDRLLDVEWISDVIKAARTINDLGISHGVVSDDYGMEDAILNLRKVFKRA